MSSLLNSVAERLKAERGRLGLTQTDLAEAGGVKKGAQIKYEKGERSPDCEYLAAVAERGVDVAYVLTGIRSVRQPGIKEAELEQFNQVIEDFWQLSDDGRRRLLSFGESLVQGELHDKGETRGLRKLDKPNQRPETEPPTPADPPVKRNVRKLGKLD